MSCDMSHISIIPVKSEARFHHTKYTCNVCIPGDEGRLVVRPRSVMVVLSLLGARLHSTITRVKASRPVEAGR